MSARERIRRPELPRREPIRSWSALFGPGPGPQDGGGGFLAASAREPIARGVELGYRVIEEYLRQGQEAARLIRDQTYGPRAFTNDFEQVAGRLLRNGAELTSLWFEMLGTLAAGGGLANDSTGGPWPTAGGAWPTPGAAATPAPAEKTEPAAAPRAAEPAPGGAPVETTGAVVEVRSPRPVEVSLELRPQSADRPLVVHELRSVARDAPRLSDVSLRAGTGGKPPRLRLRVPQEQPTGVYSGAIVDAETSRPWGTLCVRVLDEPGP
jgi:hypothetical protein